MLISWLGSIWKECSFRPGAFILYLCNLVHFSCILLVRFEYDLAGCVTLLRSSNQRSFIKKMFLKTSQNSWEKHLYRSLFFNKVAGIRPLTLLKERLWQRCFLVNFAKCLRTLFLQNTSRWVLVSTYDLVFLPTFHQTKHCTDH